MTVRLSADHPLTRTPRLALSGRDHATYPRRSRAALLHPRLLRGRGLAVTVEDARRIAVEANADPEVHSARTLAARRSTTRRSISSPQSRRITAGRCGLRAEGRGRGDGGV